MVSTTKIVQSSRETNTRFVICLDMAVDTARIPGDDKAVGTRTIVTADSSTSTDDHLLSSAVRRPSLRLSSAAGRIQMDVVRRRKAQNVTSRDDVDEGRWSWRRSDEILSADYARKTAEEGADGTAASATSTTLTRSLQLTLPDQPGGLHDRQDSGVVTDDVAVYGGREGVDVLVVDQRRFQDETMMSSIDERAGFDDGDPMSNSVNFYVPSNAADAAGVMHRQGSTDVEISIIDFAESERVRASGSQDATTSTV